MWIDSMIVTFIRCATTQLLETIAKLLDLIARSVDILLPGHNESSTDTKRVSQANHRQAGCCQVEFGCRLSRCVLSI